MPRPINDITIFVNRSVLLNFITILQHMRFTILPTFVTIMQYMKGYGGMKLLLAREKQKNTRDGEAPGQIYSLLINY